MRFDANVTHRCSALCEDAIVVKATVEARVDEAFTKFGATT